MLVGQALAIALATVTASAALAEFTGQRRSINGTGETLSTGETEAGLTSVAYGITDDWQVRVPSLAMLVGYGRLEARHRWRLDDKGRFSPYAALETPRHLVLGADYGWDLGAQQEHSVTVGARLQYGPMARPGADGQPLYHSRPLVLPSCEYDYYWRGNVAYGGIDDYRIYLGHTWAFSRLHVGLILSPAAGFLPLPYAYWRF